MIVINSPEGLLTDLRPDEVVIVKEYIRRLISARKENDPTPVVHALFGSFPPEDKEFKRLLEKL